MQTPLIHFQTLMGPHGLYQHATGQEPLLREGYCTDDNARAVHLLVQWLAVAEEKQRGQLEALLQPAWQFLLDARLPNGTWHNFRSADGEWLMHGISDDMYARLVRACATVIRYDTSPIRQKEAVEMLATLEPIVRNFTALRGWAETNVALAPLPTKSQPFNSQELVATNVQRLLAAWQAHATPDWPWFEPVMVYANAIIPHGLLASFTVMPDPQLEKALHQSTDWLITSTVRDGIFVPIGSVGWYPKGGQPSIDNQQPIEAGTMFEFLLAYNEQFPDRLSPQVILAPYLWFFGANTGQVRLANPEIGAAYDGLFTKGPNTNYGAESMLAYLTAEFLLSTAPQAIRSAADTAREKYC